MVRLLEKIAEVLQLAVLGFVALWAIVAMIFYIKDKL
jgi:hypothetical protein